MKLQNSFRDYTAESSLFVRRALVAFLGILLLTGVLVANLYNVQIVRFNDYQTRSNENRIKLVPIPPSRGIIYDRNGTPLALNRTIYQLEMMPEKVDNVQQTLDALRDVVDLTDDDIAGFKKERARSHRFTSIPVKVNLSEVQVARLPSTSTAFPAWKSKATSVVIIPITRR
ncbi:penicillin-binding protein 2 (PBP-2) [Klebsiella variicola]|uniref:Penicillin-binding protein 2 (PBP-2) n=1 Tax=Klebsiella variicola TaxID=244366 RepID=A0A7H4MFN9_KLEVA|nr:penicillin-binding protein 2 (PBP-2) [Klebsiella variicola]